MKFKSIALLISAIVITNYSVYSQSAKLIVYRPASAYGSLAQYKVIVDNNEVTTLKTNSMYEMDLTPGSHTISAKQINRAVTIDAKSGETYVVAYKTPLHILGAKAKLKTFTLTEAQQNKRFMKVMDNKKGTM